MPHIFVDMDDVLCDFVKGVGKLWGFNDAEIERLRHRHHWDMRTVMAQLLGESEPISLERFWKPINGNPNFWKDLEPFPWTYPLVNQILTSKYRYHWSILTSPSQCETSYVGKHRWITQHFGSTLCGKFIPTNRKYLLAQKGTILIDDHEKNIEAFEKAGGQGILFPGLHNKNRRQYSDPLTFVLQQLEELACI
jgi:5'(3')-deoxyribonucleotidase